MIWFCSSIFVWCHSDAYVDLHRYEKPLQDIQLSIHYCYMHFGPTLCRDAWGLLFTAAFDPFLCTWNFSCVVVSSHHFMQGLTKLCSSHAPPSATWYGLFRRAVDSPVYHKTFILMISFPLVTCCPWETLTLCTWVVSSHCIRFSMVCMLRYLCIHFTCPLLGGMDVKCTVGTPYI